MIKKIMTEEVNILSLDEKIKKRLSEDIKNLEIYKSRLVELEKTFSSNISYKVRNELKKNIIFLTNKIQKLESEEDLNLYIAETDEILEKYKNLMKKPMKISFIKINKPVEDTSIVQEKNKLTENYLSIAQKYAEDIIRDYITEKSVDTNVCNNCDNTKDFIIDGTVTTCSLCGAEQEAKQYTTSYKDADRINISSKYTYDRKIHFRDCMNQYQGKQNCTIPQKVYDDLEDAFERHYLLVGDRNERKEIRFSRITRDHVGIFLKELGYSKQYENIILIHYNMTGKKPDDISHLEDTLLNEFELLIDTYDAHYQHKIDRINFISTHYVLYQLLQKHKHPCEKEDFVVLKTMDRKFFHEDICRDLFQKLGWNFGSSIF